MSVKETRFRHHPVRAERGLFIGTQQMHIAAISPALETANLRTVTSIDDVLPWDLLDINVLCADAGITKPADAIGALVDIAVNDAASAANATHLAVAPAGVIYASQTFYVYPGNVNDRVNSRLVPIFWTTDGYFAYQVEASGAGAFDYTMKLVAWLIAGTDYTQPEIPEIDLACAFRVNQ